MPSLKESVLAVDDDAHMLRMMQTILESDGYKVLTASNGETALKVLVADNPDLALLDIMMPGMDGYTLCLRIREFSQIPVIMVTAKGNFLEIARGLDCGADDYVTKPFSSKILISRVRAVLRRTKQWDKHAEPAFQSGDLVVDFAHHQVTLAGKQIELTATEYKLLYYLVHTAGRLVTFDQIPGAVWGEQYVGEHLLLRVSIARLQQKLGDDVKEPRFITSKIGIGYMFIKSN